ncbi:MAG: hypothetical protein JWO29_1836 [Arthrobacter sp.]|nr:hypothetical protein [Arthrobacter sp.]
MNSGDPAEVSRRVQEAARRLAHLTHGLERPADSHAILGSLLDTQRSLELTLRHLAELHRQTVPDVHYSAHDNTSASGVTTAVEELDLAAQQADGLKETINRAYGGSRAIRWFEEVQLGE